MPDDDVKDRIKICLPVLSLLMLTSCVLITISLIPLSSVLAKNVTTQVDDLTAKGVALDRLGNHTGAIAYYDKVLSYKCNRHRCLV